MYFQLKVIAIFSFFISVTEASAITEASMWIQSKFSGKTCEDLNKDDLDRVQAYLKDKNCLYNKNSTTESFENSNDIAENLFFNELAQTEFEQTLCEIKNVDYFSKDQTLIKMRAEEISDKLPFIKEQMYLASAAYFELQNQIGKNNTIAGYCRNSSGATRQDCLKDLEAKRTKEKELEETWRRHCGLVFATVAGLWNGSTETMMDFIQTLAKKNPIPSKEIIQQELIGKIPLVNKELLKNKLELEEQSTIQNKSRHFNNLSDETKKHLIEEALNSGFFSKALEKKDESMIKLLCRVEGKYTKGRATLNTVVGVSTFFIGGFAGLISKIPLAVRAGQIGNLLSKTRNTAAIISSLAIGTDAALVANAIGAQCFSNNINFSIKNACPANKNEFKLTELKKMEQNNCILSAALSVAPAGLLVTSKAIKVLATKISKSRQNIQEIDSQVINSSLIEASSHSATSSQVSSIKSNSASMEARITDSTSVKVLSSENSLAEKVDPAAFKANPQIEIWRLTESGSGKQAAILTKEIENSLQNSKVVTTHNLGNTASKPVLVTLENGLSGVWKKMEGGFTSGEAEIAAYKVDQKLGLNNVPITVERELNGVKGTIQLFIPYTDKVRLNNEPRSFSFFDTLLNNRDRHGGNYLTAEGRPILIDNGLSFDHPDAWKKIPDFFGEVRKSIFPIQQQINKVRVTEGKLDEAAIKYGNNSVEYKTLRQQLDVEIRKEKDLIVIAKNDFSVLLPDRAVYQRLKETTEKEWIATLKDHLSTDQLANFLARRDEVISGVERVTKVFGDDMFRDGPISPLVRTQTKPKFELKDFANPNQGVNKNILNILMRDFKMFDLDNIPEANTPDKFSIFLLPPKHEKNLPLVEPMIERRDNIHNFNRRFETELKNALFKELENWKAQKKK